MTLEKILIFVTSILLFNHLETWAKVIFINRQVLRFPSPIKLTALISLKYIIESGIQQHNLNPNPWCFETHQKSKMVAIVNHILTLDFMENL